MRNTQRDTTVRVEHQASPGVSTSVVHQPCCREIFISARMLKGRGPADLFRRVSAALREFDATIVCQQVFGFSSHDSASLAALRETFGEPNWPVTWLEGTSSTDSAGIEVWAVASAAVRPLHLNGAVVGSVFSNGESQICRLGGLLPPDKTASPLEQTRAVLDMMREGLEAAGMDFGHVVRTWFHNRDILSWYGQFNEVRDRFFREVGLFEGLIPASTGVAGDNQEGSALTAGLLAIRPTAPGTTVSSVRSPLQCSAMDYGKSFSRAVEVCYPEHRRVYVSGTASIEPGGHTAHTGDLARQIDLTLRVVQAILESRQTSWRHVVRAIAYIKHAKDVPAARVALDNTGLSDQPMLIAQNDICRDDLLFELEIDAIAPVVQRGFRHGLLEDTPMGPR